MNNYELINHDQEQGLIALKPNVMCILLQSQVSVFCSQMYISPESKVCWLSIR